MKKSLLLFSMFLSVIYCYSQPSISWQKSLGGTGGDVMTSIQQTTDGGYITAGYSNSNDKDVAGNHGDIDYWVVKLTNTGTIEWQKCLGGTLEELAFSIQETTDGGYIIAGNSYSNNNDVTGNHGGQDFWIVKLTNTGIIEWQKCLGGSLIETAKSIQQTTDGGYIISGRGGSNLINGQVISNHGGFDSLIVKLTNTGTIEWQKSLGGTLDEMATSIRQTADGGYIIAGYSNSNDNDVAGNHGSNDYWIVKLTNTGVLEWQKSLGGTLDEMATSIQQTTDGGYIIAGYSNSNDNDVAGNHGGQDFWIVKLSNAGIIEWQKSLGGTLNELAFSIQQTTDGGYIIAGYTNSNDNDVTENHGGQDFWIVKLSNLGIIEWQKSLGGTLDENANSIQQTTNGGYIIAGHARSNDVDVTGNHGWYDCWIVKLNSTLSTDELNIENLFSVYPNPVNKEINVNTKESTFGLPYTIYDQLGKSVMTGKLNEQNSIIETDNLPKGVYIFSVGDKVKTSTKIIKQ